MLDVRSPPSTRPPAVQTPGLPPVAALARERREPHGPRAALQVRWARDEADVRRAQALRHQVFVGEMGARIAPPRGTPAGLDVDLFDAYCEHLLVTAGEDPAGPVVGTYRVLTPDAARRAGGYYSETEFDLTRLRPLRPTMVELGRSCVHRDWRDGGTMLLLWAALASFMDRNGLQTMLGCASVSMRDGGHQAAELWHALAPRHLAPLQWQVRARLPLPVDELASGQPATVPPLIKGYLRCGASLLGGPAWDPDFGTADLPMMLRLADLPAAYRRHFLAR